MTTFPGARSQSSAAAALAPVALAPVALALALLIPVPAGAQIAAAVDLRAGGGVGRYDMAGGDMDRAIRPVWRVGISVSPRPDLHLVGSYGQSEFACADGFCAGADVSFRSAGVELGVRVGAGGDRHGPWLQGDLIGHTLHASWTDAADRTDLAAGWGLAAGYHIPLHRRLALSPALRVQTYRAALGNDPEPYRVSLAAAELGLRLRVR